MQTEIASSPQKFALTIKEVARATGLSRSLIYVAISRGMLRARKCGARTLVLDTDLRRFLRSLPALARCEAAPTPSKQKRNRERDLRRSERKSVAL
jgi:excisionase family DNA binding protein